MIFCSALYEYICHGTLLRQALKVEQLSYQADAIRCSLFDCVEIFPAPLESKHSRKLRGARGRHGNDRSIR